MCNKQPDGELLRVHPPVLLKADDPLYRMPDPDSMGYVFLMPEGPRQINEAGDVFYIKDARVAYHDHSRGYETFLIDGGAVESTLHHKQCVMEKGDLMHIRPGVHHGFHHLVENTIWREVFQEIDMYSSCNQRDILRELRPEILADPEFQASRRKRLGTNYREMPLARVVDKHEISQVRPHGCALRSFCFSGMELGLKVGRWETDGVREIWEFRFPKGTTLEFARPFDSSPLYAVMEGAVQADLFDGMDVYTAQERDFLHIPAYTPHSLTIMEENTRIFAYNVQSELLNALEALDAEFTRRPEQMGNWPWIEQVLREYDCWLTGIKFSGQEVNQ